MKTITENISHTKGEWYTFNDIILSKGDFPINKNKVKPESVKVLELCTENECKNEWKANARLIVKSVNNHQKLVDTLRSLLNMSYDTARPTKSEKNYNIDKATELLRSIDFD